MATDKKIEFCINLPKKKKDRKTLDAYLVREVIVPWRSRKRIPSLMEQFPKIRYTLDTPCVRINQEIKEFLQEYTDNVRLRFKTLKNAFRFFELNAGLRNKFYTSEIITDFITIDDYIAAGACSVTVGGSTLMWLNSLIPIANKIELRMCPILGDGTIMGQFVRPEDTDLYEDVIKIIDFSYLYDVLKEKTLTKVYFKGEWFYNLEMLGAQMPNIENSLIVDSFGERRLNCKRICQVGSYCLYCANVADIASKVEQYLKEEESNKNS